jgi:hypothetical protein
MLLTEPQMIVELKVGKHGRKDKYE